MPRSSTAERPPQLDEHVREFEEFIAHVALRLRRDGSDFESETGLSNPELSVLARLETGAPISAKTLVAELEIPASTLSAIADRLERRGLIERHSSDEDRRSVLFVATAAAEELLRSSQCRFREVATSFVEALSVAEQRELVRLLRRLRTVL